MQQSYDRKLAINKRITETHNKKNKAIAVGITTGKQSVVAATITGFMNTHQSQNEAGSSSGSSHMNDSNVGVNIQAANTENFPLQM